MSDQCYLYIIGAVGADKPVKIGIAANPRARLAQLQTGNPQILEIKESFWALKREQAAYWEELAHQLFSQQRINGEWFNVTAAEVSAKAQAWRDDGEPRRAPQIKVAKKLPAASRDFEPNHPYIPPELRNRSTEEMTEEERLEYWACFDLGAPPEGFDDWYIVGSESAGVMGAFPVVGFMHGVKDK